MKTTTLFRLLPVLVLLSGCYAAQKQKLLKEEFRTEAVALPLTAALVHIRDSRSNIEDRNLRIVGPDQKRSDALEPPLTSPLRELIQGEVRRYLTGGEPTVNVMVEVVQGRQMFEATATRAREASEVELQVTLSDPSGRTLYTGWGKVKPEVESATGSQQYSDALFSRALEMSLYGAFRRIRSEFF
jgi:hypothetical protein